MKKTICDNCGEEAYTYELCFVEFNIGNWASSTFHSIGDYCEKCKVKIEERIKEGIQ